MLSAVHCSFLLLAANLPQYPDAFTPNNARYSPPNGYKGVVVGTHVEDAIWWRWDRQAELGVVRSGWMVSYLV